MKYKPTLIIHGGAGALSRAAIPPPLYDKYHASLLSYLRSTHDLLDSGSSALDAAVHAVSLLEDDELFNCARGSVFTSAGTIEMEASLMVTSLNSPEPSPGCPTMSGMNLPSDSYSDNQPNAPTSHTRIHKPSDIDTDIDSTKNKNAHPYPGSIKRGVGVIGLRNVRHPIQLAREVLLRHGLDNDGDGGTMHAQLSAPYVEDLARQWGLEFEPDEYFWTQRRWDEHLRKLRQSRKQTTGSSIPGSNSATSTCNPNIDGMLPDPELDLDLNSLPQGTVGCVCLDQHGNLAVATSTGGMTNKVPGRVGDTPTLGAGFWAERWSEPFTSMVLDSSSPPLIARLPRQVDEEKEESMSCWSDCTPSFLRRRGPWTTSLAMYSERERYTDEDTDRGTDTNTYPQRYRHSHRNRSTIRKQHSLENEKHLLVDSSPYTPYSSPPSPSLYHQQTLPATKTTAVALSGTGNGDSFLRICAARTACAMARFSPGTSFSRAVSEVAGPGGELQRSAGDRWGSGEGEGGMIGIAVEGVDCSQCRGRDQDGAGDCVCERVGRGQVVWDFNCGGMWRAWIEEDFMGREKEMVMVFKESYY